MIKELNGIITEDNEFCSLCIGDDILTDFVEEIDGQMVSLKYYISDNPINKQTAVENFLHSFYEGFSDVDGNYCYGSSWTGCYAKNKEFSVGGHNIIKEMYEHLGKYCYLIIETMRK